MDESKEMLNQQPVIVDIAKSSEEMGHAVNSLYREERRNSPEFANRGEALSIGAMIGNLGHRSRDYDTFPGTVTLDLPSLTSNPASGEKTVTMNADALVEQLAVLVETWLNSDEGRQAGISQHPETLSSAEANIAELHALAQEIKKRNKKIKLYLTEAPLSSNVLRKGFSITQLELL